MLSFVIFGGRRLLGRVDQVTGLFHVATQFVHIFFIPFIPMKSFVVFDGTENGSEFRGVEIDISVKSVLAAYARAFFILAALYQVYKMVTLFPHLSVLYFVYLILIIKLVVYVGLFILSRKFLRASREGALALAAKVGIDKGLIEQRF